MTMPGFTAELALASRASRFASAMAAARAGRAEASITPAQHGVEFSIGHCGCYADDWFGSPCLCIEYW